MAHYPGKWSTSDFLCVPDPAVREGTEQSGVQARQKAAGYKQRGLLVQEREGCAETSGTARDGSR